MLALSAWCGTAKDFLKESSKYLVFSKISNAYLGAIDKRSVDIHNVQHVIRDMQHQVSQLIRHTERPSKFMLLYAPELLVAPSFVFSDFLTCIQAKCLVESINQAHTLHAMWSEDDSYAKEVLTKKGYHWTHVPNGGNSTLTLGLLTDTSSMRCEPIPRECWVFNFPSKVTTLEYIPFFVGPLDMFPWVESLELHWFSDSHTMTPLQNTTTLRKLIVHNGVPYESLVNSKHITNLVVNKGALHSDVGKLIHMTSLSLHGGLHLMTLPNEVSKLVNLRVLKLTEVREVIPSCIEALVGLEHLALTWCHVRQVRTSGVASIDFSKFVALRCLHLESNHNLVGDVQLASLNLLYILFRNNHVLLVKPEPKREGCWCFDQWRAKQIPT